MNIDASTSPTVVHFVPCPPGRRAADAPAGRARRRVLPPVLLSREDTDYVLETFPIVRKNDVKAHDEYRTKRLIPDAYDHMALAARPFSTGLGAAGRPYLTPLDPPVADPRMVHPADTRPEEPR